MLQFSTVIFQGGYSVDTDYVKVPIFPDFFLFPYNISRFYVN